MHVTRRKKETGLVSELKDLVLGFNIICNSHCFKPPGIQRRAVIGTFVTANLRNHRIGRVVNLPWIKESWKIGNGILWDWSQGRSVTWEFTNSSQYLFPHNTDWMILQTIGTYLCNQDHDTSDSMQPCTGQQHKWLQPWKFGRNQFVSVPNLLEKKMKPEISTDNILWLLLCSLPIRSQNLFLNIL